VIENISANEFRSMLEAFGNIPEKEIPDVISESGIHINEKEKRWEIWFVDDKSNSDKPALLGFCNFKLGEHYKNKWKKEFFQYHAGLNLPKDGWEC